MKWSEHTGLSPEALQTNIDAVDYIVDNNIKGAIVECGIYKGGSIATMCGRLVERNDVKRDVWLFDTFDGMTEPCEYDYKTSNKSGTYEFALNKYHTVPDWCRASLDHVKRVMNTTKYPQDKIHYVIGDIRKTLPCDVGQIAILRHDTDFYESTKSEMEHLHPLCVGVEIFDDYQTWLGSRKATLEVIKEEDLIKKGTIMIYYCDKMIQQKG